MLRLSRSFSKLAQQVLNVDSLKYKYPWNLSQAGSIKISTVKSQHYLKAFSILASTYTKDVNILEIWLREMEKKLASEGFSYTINRDYVNLNMVGDENIRYQLMRILELMKSAETGNVKHRRIDEDIESILVRSCFEMPVLKLSQPLFTGEYFVASSLDLKESDFSQFDKNIITPSEPQEYKAAMVLVESPQDSCEISLAFKCPSFLSPDYFLFKFLSHFLSTDNSYTLDVSKQFNYLNSLFSGIPGIYSHSCKLYNGLKSSLIIHTLQTHPYSSTLAAASILKANKRACQEIILYELERTQGLILNSMLKDKPFLSSCMNRNFEVYSNKNESDFKDFVINLNEEYIVGGLSKYLKSQFPSIVVKGKIYSDNVIENIFNIKFKESLACIEEEERKFVGCPLDNPELPIVTENEHKLGHCYCHHCKCKLHVCPGERAKVRTASSGWFSQYKQEFRKKVAKRDHPFVAIRYSPIQKGEWKDTLKSVSQLAYNPFSPTKQESCKPKQTSTPSKFTAKTSYEHDYINFKAEKVKSVSPIRPYRGYMVKPWESESIYKSTFKSLNSPANSIKKGIQHQHKSLKNLITPEPHSIFDTTSKLHFKPGRSSTPSINDLGYLRNKTEICHLQNPKSHYKSVYLSEFSPKPVKYSLNRLR